MKKLFRLLLTLVMVIGLLILNRNNTIAEEENANNYVFTYASSIPPSGIWTKVPEPTTVVANEVFEFTIATGSSACTVIDPDGGTHPVTSSDVGDRYKYVVKYDGASVTTSGNTATIVEGTPPPQPKPIPSPSEPVVKDESCEKVIGPTWHWNNDLGVCEEYSTIGTSTR